MLVVNTILYHKCIQMFEKINELNLETPYFVFSNNGQRVSFLWLKEYKSVYATMEKDYIFFALFDKITFIKRKTLDKIDKFVNLVAESLA
jgi:hypothetical protein